MADFNPPFSERSIKEVVLIAHASTEEWQQAAIDAAKKELMLRAVPRAKQEEILKNQRQKEALLRLKEEERLENNKTESYTKLEMILLFLLGPLVFIGYFSSGRNTLFTLRKDNYQLKFKQRLILFILSFITWFYCIDYSTKIEQKKRLEAMEKVDISDWEEKHGYDN